MAHRSCFNELIVPRIQGTLWMQTAAREVPNTFEILNAVVSHPSDVREIHHIVDRIHVLIQSHILVDHFAHLSAFHELVLFEKACFVLKNLILQVLGHSLSQLESEQPIELVKLWIPGVNKLIDGFVRNLFPPEIDLVLRDTTPHIRDERVSAVAVPFPEPDDRWESGKLKLLRFVLISPVNIERKLFF